MISAALRGSQETTLKKLIDAGGDINERDEEDLSSLAAAVIARNTLLEDC